MSALFTDIQSAARLEAEFQQSAARKRALSDTTPAGRSAAAARAAEQEREEYAVAIFSLPEAQDRPAAASKLSFSYDARSMPVAKAKLFLAGLPIEQSTNAAPLTNGPTMTDPTMKRRAELRIAALSARANEGDEYAKSECRKLSYGLKLHATTTLPLTAALEQAGADVSKIR